MCPTFGIYQDRVMSCTLITSTIKAVLISQQAFL